MIILVRCVAFLDFFAKAQEARELTKNRELNLHGSRDRSLSHRTKIIEGNVTGALFVTL